jgi:hypothetical protein
LERLRHLRLGTSTNFRQQLRAVRQAHVETITTPFAPIHVHSFAIAERACGSGYPLGLVAKLLEALLHPTIWAGSTRTSTSVLNFTMAKGVG